MTERVTAAQSPAVLLLFTMATAVAVVEFFGSLEPKEVMSAHGEVPIEKPGADGFP